MPDTSSGKVAEPPSCRSDSLHGLVEILQLAATKHLWVAGKNLLDQC